MNFDFTRLLTPAYFLDKNPGGDFLLGYGLLAFFIMVLFAKTIVRRFGPENKYFRKSIRHGFGKFIALGIAGLILVASRFSAVPVFSMRLWLWIVFGLTVIFGILIFFRVRREYGQRLSAVEREKHKRGEW